MSVMEDIKEVITGKKAIKGPIFLKETSDANDQLEKLNHLLVIAPSNVKAQIEQDIKLLSYGIAGEKAVAFELKNSFYPMIVLHDLYFEYQGLTAQIDYFIVTKKINLVIECKNLFGNIEVNNAGDFVRTMEFYKKKKKEGIYSPITQNQRHLELIRKARSESKNIVMKAFYNKGFDNKFKSVVVLANPKTVINMKYAKKEVKEKIIRCDQLIDYIKKLDSISTNDKSSDSDMMSTAEIYLNMHTTNKVDYTAKYGISDNSLEVIQEVKDSIVAEKETLAVNNTINQGKSACDVAPIGIKVEDMPLYKDLKEFRLTTSRTENVKAYVIFSNSQLEEIIKIMPHNINDLKQVSGFGDSKCKKYGTSIIEICAKY